MNLMRLNKARCKALHLGRGNHWYQYGLGDEGIESSPAKKDLGIVVDERLGMSHQCVLTARILGCIKTSVGSKSREVILPPLLCSGETPRGVLHPALKPPAQERHGAVGVGSEEGSKKEIFLQPFST